MRNSLRSFGVVAIAMLGVVACNKKDSGAAAAASASAAALAAGEPPGSGLGAAGNDPELVAAVKSMIASCGPKWDEKKGWPDDCEKPYTELKVDYGKQDKTLVAFLEDADPKVRELGADGLDRWGDGYRTDKDLATRLVTALEHEKSLAFQGVLAYVVAHIDLTKAPVGDRIKALALKPTENENVRAVITVWWPQETGESNTAAYDVVKAYSTSADKRMKTAALDGYAKFDENKHDEACAFWAANIADPDADIAGVAFGHLTHGWTGVNAQDKDSGWYASGGGHSGDLRCSQVDQAVALATQKATAGTITDSNFVYGLGFVAKDTKATPAQKKQATTGLRDVISNKANSARSLAVERLVEADPSQKSFVAKFQSDPSVASTVASVLAAKKKK